MSGCHDYDYGATSIYMCARSAFVYVSVSADSAVAWTPSSSVSVWSRWRCSKPLERQISKLESAND